MASHVVLNALQSDSWKQQIRSEEKNAITFEKRKKRQLRIYEKERVSVKAKESTTNSKFMGAFARTPERLIFTHLKEQAGAFTDGRVFDLTPTAPIFLSARKAPHYSLNQPLEQEAVRRRGKRAESRDALAALQSYQAAVREVVKVSANPKYQRQDPYAGAPPPFYNHISPEQRQEVVLTNPYYNQSYDHQRAQKQVALAQKKLRVPLAELSLYPHLQTSRGAFNGKVPRPHTPPFFAPFKRNTGTYISPRTSPPSTLSGLNTAHLPIVK